MWPNPFGRFLNRVSVVFDLGHPQRTPCKKHQLTRRTSRARRPPPKRSPRVCTIEINLQYHLPRTVHKSAIIRLLGPCPKGAIGHGSELRPRTTSRPQPSQFIAKPRLAAPPKAPLLARPSDDHSLAFFFRDFGEPFAGAPANLSPGCAAFRSSDGAPVRARPKSTPMIA